ncbi:MAG: hypothetical protein DME25_08380 [Verrucomicrobia bacterium]|nr:MAG: hypothetical protein DME25_08380 [Verrucomicrobiota bacterium]
MLFRLTSGESVPFSAEMISVELLGDTAKESDPDLLDEAAKAVFHYFKHDLERNSVTVGEFAMALEKVLSSLAQAERAAAERRPAQRVLESDLRRLALESGQGCERQQLRQAPRLVRFRGLRGAVKQLVGARRWGARCHVLEEQIVGYLRECVSADGNEREFALVVE